MKGQEIDLQSNLVYPAAMVSFEFWPDIEANRLKEYGDRAGLPGKKQN